jgi:hypothetical protein
MKHWTEYITWPLVTLVLGVFAMLFIGDGYLLHIHGISPETLGHVAIGLTTAVASAITAGVAAHARGHAEGFVQGLQTMPPTPPGTEYRLVPSYAPPPSDEILRGEQSLRQPSNRPSSVEQPFALTHVEEADHADTQPQSPQAKRGSQ